MAVRGAQDDSGLRVSEEFPDGTGLAEPKMTDQAASAFERADVFNRLVEGFLSGIG